jgi:hypothetical protein
MEKIAQGVEHAPMPEGGAGKVGYLSSPAIMHSVLK